MITLADIKKPLPFTISVGMSGQSIRDYAENHFGDVLDFEVFLPSINKNLQRDLVWTLEQKQSIVLSVFKETHIPAICVIHIKEQAGNLTKGVTIQVIDGKQRLTSMLGFYKNEFPIVVKGNEYYFKDLSESLQKQYARYNPLTNIAYSYIYKDGDKTAFIDDQAKIDWFEMINFAGTPQDIEHLNSLKK